MSPRLLPAAVGTILLGACSPSTPPAPPSMPALLQDVTASAGIAFTHFAGASAAYHVPEIMGAGVALFDLDGDGDLDAYLVQGARVDSSVPPLANAPPGALRNAVLRNDSAGANLSFIDVTDTVGGGDGGFGMGVAAGDVDGDGDTDLYVTNLGANVLYRNDDGQLRRVAGAGGAQDTRWSTSASFCDIDDDGDLDLFVTNYLGYSYEEDLRCTDTAGLADYCSPASYPAVSDSLFRNDGSGRFENISEPTRIATQPAAGLGVACLDADGDGRRDFYVANDGMANHLWRQAENGVFEDVGLASGTAYNASGAAEAGMGVLAEDFDEDADTDLFITHLNGETNTLYRNEGSLFTDMTAPAGLGPMSLPFTGFGTATFALDDDRHRDLFIANGAVTRQAGRPGALAAYAQHNQVFLGLGDGRFTARESFLADPTRHISRGTARGDVDGDGDEDLLITNNHGPAQLWLNLDAPADVIVIALRASEGLVADGASVRFACADGSIRYREVRRDGSYLSANSPWLHVQGCGPIADITVRWPGGGEQVYANVRANPRVQWLSAEPSTENDRR